MLGFLLGGALCVRNMVKNGCSFPLAVIAVTAGLYGGLLGARALYVLIFSPHLFLEDPIYAIAFWQGTGSWMGGFFLGAIGVMIVLKVVNKPFWSNIGSMAPGLALGHAVGRVGCLFAGCCYGAPTSVPWSIYSSKLNEMVHPTQLYSMIGELISFAILQRLWRKPERRAYLPAVYGMLLAVHRFISESFRSVEAGPVIIPGLHVYQAVCVFFFAFSLILFLVLKWKKSALIPAVGIALFTVTLTVSLKPASPPVSDADKDRTGVYLVITRDVFSETLDRWVAERRKNGFEVLIRSWRHAPSAMEIRAWIRQQADRAGVRCRYILVVGDCGADEEIWNEWHMPSVQHEFQFNQQTRRFPADALYGDLDQSGDPDIPVGRLAVRSPSQLKSQIHKILTYQKQQPASGLPRAVIWAGAKGYASETHRIVNSLAGGFPKWLTPVIIGGDVQVDHSEIFAGQPKAFIEQISRSPFISVVASHGSYRSVSLTPHGESDVFLAVEDVAQLTSPRPSGAMFLLGCDAGKFNTPSAWGVSLSEAFAAHPGGPVGVVAATGETGPLTNYFFAMAMIDQITMRHRTIGDFVLGVQRRLYRQGERSMADISLSDRFARKLMGAVPDDERHLLFTPGLLRYEVLTYNLLGDPACELK